MMNRIFTWAARRILGRADHLALSSEMEELYQYRLARDGKHAADRWLRRERRRAVGHLAGIRAADLPDPEPPQPLTTTPTLRLRETMYNMIRELRSSLRGLARTPIFALTIIATLAIGIGGATAVFSVINAVLLEPLPYPESSELVRISNHARGQDWVFSVADYLALEEQQTRFEGVAAMAWNRATYASGEATERMLVHSATPSFFSLLDLRPEYGRTFTAEEGEPGAPSSALVSWGFWNREMDGDPAALGRTIRLDGQDVTVIGVLPRRAGPLLADAEVVTALQLAPPARKGPFFLVALGRLGEGVAPASAAAELRTINERIFPLWQDSWPDQETTWAMTGLKEYVVGDVGATLLIVLGAATFVLLMVCVNSASLLLARLMDRRRELAVRTALGATRGQLMRHLLTESALLSIVGAGAGLLVTVSGIRLVTAFGADFIPRTNEVGLTGPVLLFFAVAATASLVLFGLFPSLRGTGAGVARDLRESGHGAGTVRSASRTRGLLVAGQFAVSVPLIVGGGLLLASLTKLANVDPGFDADRVLTMNVAVPNDRYPSAGELSEFWRSLLTEVRSLPGVEEAGVGTGRPPSEYPFTNNFVLEDQPLAPGETQPTVPWVVASPEYFHALGSPLVAGRMFDRTLDDPDPDFIVLVDRAWATRFYDSPEGALGRRFRAGGCTGDDCAWFRVVGVMENVKYSGLNGTSQGVVYMNADQAPNRNSFLVVRAAPDQDPLGFIPMVRNLIRQAEVEAAISRVASGDDLLRADLRVPRYLAILVGSFGAISLLLAVVGIYGIMAYYVRQHRRDIGIRLALGGEPGNVIGLVLKNGLGLVAWGVTAGLVGAVILTRFMDTLLFGVEPTDPYVLGASLGTMALVAIAACWGPARRAARVPPREVLAEE
ncbi:ABC transporter permease [Gemmatimonadota bacterium]